MDPQPSSELSRYFRLGAIGFVVLAILAGIYTWLSTYLTVGSVDITTSGNNTITLMSDPDHTVVKSAKGELKTSTKKGNYFVSVTSNYTGATQQIAVSPHATFTLDLSPGTPSDTEPVLYDQASHISVSPTELSYLDDGSNFARIDSSDTVQTLNENVAFGTISWGDPGFGFGCDSQGNLYLVSGTQVTPFQYPSGVSSSGPVIAVSSSHQIYVAIAHDLYLVSTAGKWTKIYGAPNNITKLSAGTDQVVVLAPIDGTNSTVAIVSNTGQKQVEKTLPASNIALSPSEQYVTVSTASVTTVTDNQLGALQTIPEANPANVVWQGDTTLYYSVDDKIWSYDISQQESQMIGIAPLGYSITELALNSDSSYLYVGATTSDTFNIQQLYRIGLNHQAIPKILTNLQDILPDKEDLYILSLVNFYGPPTVTVKPELGAYPAQVQQQAQTKLQQDGFDLSQLRLIVLPPVT